MAGGGEVQVRTARWKKGLEARRENQAERKPMVDEKRMGELRTSFFLVGLMTVIRGSDVAAVD